MTHQRILNLRPDGKRALMCATSHGINQPVDRGRIQNL